MATKSSTTEVVDKPTAVPTNPTSPPVEPGPKVETMDDLGITPTTPYPTGSPPSLTYAQINGLEPMPTTGG